MYWASTRLALDPVERRNVPQSPFDDTAAVIGVRAVQFPAHARHPASITSPSVQDSACVWDINETPSPPDRIPRSKRTFGGDDWIGK